MLGSRPTLSVGLTICIPYNLVVDQYKTDDAKEVLDRTVKPFGSGGAHITIPKRWIGAEVKVVRVSDPDPPDE